MRKFVAVVTFSTVFMLTGPPSASASYWSNGGRCVLTEEGMVLLRGRISTSDGSWSYYGPVRWVYRMRELGAASGWTHIDRGFRERVIVHSDASWEATFRSTTPMPTTGFAYQLLGKPTGWTFALTRYNDNKDNPFCRTRAA